MPSKNKKGSKSASKFSNSSDCSSVTSPWNPNSAPPQQTSEADVQSILEEASRKFPSLIGKNALVAQITEDADTESFRGTCKIWLSEPSMLAHSLSPGATVSVSLASSTNKFVINSPVRSLADVCEKQYEFASELQMVGEVGNYFALAAVFPSRKILKNGVRLSQSLSRTMGSPPSGSILFVHPVCLQPTTRFANGNGKLQSTNYLSVSTCKELYLELVFLNSESTTNSNKFNKDAFSAETTNVPAENGAVSSPKTPFSQSKFSSPSISHVSTPRASTTREDESVSSKSNNNGTTIPSFDIQEVLENESAKNLLQTCATSWLSSRRLLCGNIVVIPILSKICTFQVLGADKLSANHHILNVTDGSHSDISFEDFDLVDHVDEAFLVDHITKVYLFPPAKNKGLLRQELNYKEVRSHATSEIPKLGGISKQYAELKDIIISSTSNGKFSSLGLRPIKGVLLYGPPGTGKSSLAKLCVNDTGVNLFHVKGPEIVSQYYGESEQALSEVFDSASRAAPAVVFIDELDAIAPARKEGSEELSQRMVATLLNLMDGIISVEGLLVIAATNRPDSIEPALRRPGRFDIEIDIGVPSPDQRYDILLALLKEKEHSLSDTEVQYLAKATHGFVGADLAVLCNEAKLICLRRYTDLQISYDEPHCNISPFSSPDIIEGFNGPDDINDSTSQDHLDYTCSSALESPVRQENLDNEILNVSGTSAVERDTLRVSFDDFERARKKIGPSAMREVILEIPKISWEDVGGQKEVKMQLKEAVEWPQKYQDSFRSLGILPPKGVLMFGPPGCSKTLLARAVASEAGLNFLAVKGPELFSMWVGESEKAVRSLFAKATANAPSIIFFDEIDSLASIRGKESDGVSVGDRVISQLLVEMDGLQKRVDVTVIAATNRPDNIDPALLRPGRFDRLLYVGPPNVVDREDIFRVHLCKMPCSIDVSPKELALCTEGCSGADIFQICREAALAALEETFDASCISMKHLEHAISRAQPSLVQFDQTLLTKFQRMVHSTATEDELGCQSSSSTSHWNSFWTPIKSIMQWPFQFPSTLLYAKSSP
ncbi:hypothetical protein DCAR_0625766 [Daucus carota subsp. sativus]|uniref:AAA+ ATPase domain-containing protein n=1 Tax=Daucus carota subsp. sativus TaxID=79200 RepID=A0A161ZVH1_DAUCS|nr:PREDICTED: calmodulin-interacting protein 111 [Daucus carota subsp. sativus]WOH06340.1 hypothetical protein DCAR_0625766 [Daucus carota subsp. sativus]